MILGFRGGMALLGSLDREARHIAIREGALEEVPLFLLSVSRPVDCGALWAPAGAAGVQHWLEHDHTVFRNVWGVGESWRPNRVGYLGLEL